MRIEKLEVTNFEGIGHIEDRPGHITALIGPNGTGKTSYIRAIGAALCGTADGRVIRDGAASASVELTDGETGVTVKSTFGKVNRYDVNGKKSKKADYDVMVGEIAGLPPEEIKIVTASEVAMGLKAPELTGFMMKYIPEKQDRDKVLSYATGLSVEARGVIGRNLPDGEFDLSTLGAAHDMIVEMRKMKKRELQIAQAACAKEPEKPECPRAEAQERYEAALRAEAAAGAYERQLADHRRALKAAEAQKEKIAALKSEIAGITAAKTDPAAEEKVKARLGDALGAKERAVKAKEAFLSNADHFEDVLDALEDDVCVICRSLEPDMAFECKSPEKLKARKAIEDLVKMNRENAAAQDAAIKAAQDAADAAQAELDALRKQEAEYMRKVMLTKQLSDLEAAKIPVPKEPEKPGDGGGAEEKARWKAAIAACDLYDAFLRNRDLAAGTEAEVKAYDEAAKALEPKGPVMDAIMRHYVAIFEGICNETASEIREGLEMHFEIDDGVRFSVTPGPGKSPLRYDELSNGERQLAALLMLDMFNRLTGLGILILDDMDKLDAGTFAQVMDAVDGPMGERYDHIFLSLVDHSDLVGLVPDGAHNVFDGSRGDAAADA